MANGDFTLEKALTGAYITGVDPRTGLQPNVNAEGGEYILTPEGSVLEVWGDKHKQGGVNMILPSMTAVLSDTKDLTIKKSDVKKLESKYGLKGVKTTMTYSDVLDRYSRKIGRTKVVNEIEDYMKKIRQQSEKRSTDGMSNDTIDMNVKFIGEKIQELKKQADEKEGQMREMFIDMFTSQQKQKPKKGVSQEYVPQTEENQVVEQAPQNEQIRETEYIPTEGQLSQTEVFELGGYVNDFKGLASKYGWTERKLYDTLKSKNMLPKFDGGGWVEFDQYQRNYQNIPNYKSGDLNAQGARLRALLSATGNDILSTLTLDTQQQQDYAAGQYQNWVYNNMGEVATDYSSSMAPTKAGLEYLVKNNIVTKEDFNKMGIKIPERAGNILGFKEGELTEDKVKEVNNFIQSKLTPETSKEYLKNNFIDNKWLYRAPEIREVRFSSEEEKENTLKDYEDLGNGVYKSNKTGLYFKPIVGNESTPKAEIPETSPSAGRKREGEAIKDDLNLQARRNRVPKAYWNPDESVPPPSPLLPETLEQINLQRIDPIRVGIEPVLQRLGEERTFVARQLEGIPSSQRASVLANTVANAQKAESEAIMNATAKNAANFAAAEQYNIGKADQEEMANAQMRLNYEARVLRGLDNYEKDMFNYQMANRAIYLNQYQNQMNLNRLDQMFPDVSLDTFGIGYNYNPQGQFSFNKNEVDYNKVVQLLSQQYQSEEKKKKKTEKD